MGRRKQIEIFKSFLSEEVQFDLKKLENKVKDSYNERTELNRIIKSTEIEVRNHDLYGLINTATFQLVDVEKVYKELQLARDHNQKRIEMDHRIVERELTITDINLDISELERLVREKREAIETNKTLNDEAIKWLHDNDELDLQDLEKSLSSANDMNRVHTSNEYLQIEADPFDIVEFADRFIGRVPDVSVERRFINIAQLTNRITGGITEKMLAMYRNN